MKIREEIFEHPDWWKTNFPIYELNETEEEFQLRIDYLNYIEPNENTIKKGGFYSESQLEDETIDEYRARIIMFYKSIDMGVNEKYQDDYYQNEENIKKDMLKGELDFNRQWYENYLRNKHSN